MNRSETPRSLGHLCRTAPVSLSQSTLPQSHEFREHLNVPSRWNHLDPRPSPITSLHTMHNRNLSIRKGTVNLLEKPPPPSYAGGPQRRGGGFSSRPEKLWGRPWRGQPGLCWPGPRGDCGLKGSCKMIDFRQVL